jgi:hypothetical protein
MKKIFLFTLALLFTFTLSVNASTLSSSPDLQLGVTSPYVTTLQKFLNLNNYTVNKTVGEPGSMGYETNLFGNLTKQALSSFQSAFNLPSTGYFGTQTRTKIDSLVQSGTLADTTTVASAQKGKVLGVNVGGENCPLGQAKSIERFGVTWYFNDCERYGTYANGDYWVLGPVTIWKIDPEDENPGDAWEKHGTALNPPPNTVNQGQGFDSSMNTGTWYNNARNVAPANTGQPLVVTPGNSVVSAKSVATQVSGFNAIRFEKMVTLTVVNQLEPAGHTSGTWFRPPPAGNDKSFRWSTEDLSQSLLQNNSIPSSARPIAEVLGYFEIPWMVIAEGDSMQGMFPRDMPPNYGRDAGNRLSHGLLSLLLNHPAPQKQLLYTRLVQYGIDIYGSMKAGMVHRGAGGLDNGSKAAVVLAGLALNDSDIKNWSDATKHMVFAEDKQTFYVQQWNVDQPRIRPVGVPDDNNNYYEPYLQSDADNKLPEWGVYHSVESNKDTRGWANASYRFIGSMQAGHALWARLTPGAVAAWNHPAFFDYEDRFFATHLLYPTWRNGTTNGMPTFVYDMWLAHRGGITQPTNATLSIYKSGNGSGTVTSSPSGIDCGGTCSKTYTIADNTSVTLTANPTSPAVFTGWSGGGCTGTGTCTVTMNASKSVTATFTAPPAIVLSIGDLVKVKKNDGAPVRSTPLKPADDLNKLGIQVKNTTGTVKTGSTYNNPTETNDSNGFIRWWYIDFDNSDVDGWSGEDNFEVISAGTTHTLNTHKTGLGSGTISGTGVSGPSVDFPQGTVVTLTASPNATSTFEGWSGEGCSGTNSCTVTMDGTKNVYADFAKKTTTTYPKPTNLRVTSQTKINNTKGSVTLEWDDMGVSNYLIRLKDNDDASKNTDTYDTVYSSDTYTQYTYTNNNVTPGNSYDFWVHTGVGDPVWNVSPDNRINFIATTGSSTDDSDGDEVFGNNDKCPFTKSGLKLSNGGVNKKGCPLPKTTKFDLKSDMSDMDLTSVQNFFLGKTGVGKIEWGNSILDLEETEGNKKKGMDLDNIVTISASTISVKSNLASTLNKPATITINGLTFSKPPKIKRDGAVCNAPDCVVTKYIGDLVFTVPHFSDYTFEEDTSTTTPPVITPPTVTPPPTYNRGGGGGGAPSVKPAVPTTPEAIAKLRAELIKQLISLMQQLLQQLIAELAAIK